MDYFDQIEAYLNNALSEQEKEAFEMEMDKNPELKNAVDNHGAAMDVVGSILESEVRKVIREAESDAKDVVAIIPLDRNARKTKAVVMRLNWMRWAAAAAVVFVVGWWGVNQMGVDNEQLFSQVYSDPSWPSERGVEETELSKSIVDYLTGKKKEAILSLKRIPQLESNYWLAEIYLKEMKYDSALIYLPKETLNVNKNRRDRINYIHILSLYFGGDKSKAKEAIDQLPEDTDAYYTQIYLELSF